MRSYECDSPAAMARIVIISMLADAEFGAEEVTAIARVTIAPSLGLSGDEFAVTVQAVREDLSSGIDFDWGDVRPLDPELINRLAGEVHDADLRMKVRNLCNVALHMENDVLKGDAPVVRALSTVWKLLPLRTQ
ncbi:hypothetical protein [Paraburkholderia elongata]|uniref:Co-chaperone DjlA N-terminal domain-containing protein n=1 Tax=Paraburkholderia elongata TaxID=2675747 RepID=A0A972NKH0_9BURK|nr:hypothetical protein [Paraburkholderia elongata]NPT53899.1 hypothetical protein [Paraburkholderia elongata]